MEEKFKRIESKKELFTEISVSSGVPFDSLKSNHFYPLRIDKEKYPELYDIVDKMLDRRLEYQEAVKKLHTKYFGK